MTDKIELKRGDCLEIMAGLPENSVDAIVTDPPYHLASIVARFGSGNAPAQYGTDGLFSRSSAGFLGKDWDDGDIAFDPATWAAVMRVLKPGGHLVAFNHSRMVHRMAVAIEDSGFEIRDSLFWLYGSGMPKSHNVGKGIDKTIAAASGDSEVAATPEGAEWAGWGTALKPAFEPIVLARKPIAEGSIARQTLATGTGGINIDECRVPDGEGVGKWPSNVLHDGSREVADLFPFDDDGTRARFFYCAKLTRPTVADRGTRPSNRNPLWLGLFGWLRLAGRLSSIRSPVPARRVGRLRPRVDAPS